MAKILLVCDKITHTTWQLAQALKNQQHHVLLLTGRDEEIPDAQGIEILAYFKKWNALEAGQIIPRILAIDPQIVHFVLEKDSVTAAHLMLWGYVQARPSTVFTLTLLHIEKGLTRRNLVRYLIQHSDIVTCPSVDTLARLRGIEIKSIRQGRGLLPPVLSRHESYQENKTLETLDLEELLKEKRYLVRPFAVPKFDPNDKYFTDLLSSLRKFEVVLLGSQDQWTLRDRKRFQKWLEEQGVGSRWYLTGHRSSDETVLLLKKAESFWLSGLDLTPMELTEYFLQTLEAKSTLILDEKQARLHAPLWRDGQNCWISEQPAEDGLLDKESLKLSYELDQSLIDRKDLVDAPLNELNRLYSKALAQKTFI